MNLPEAIADLSDAATLSGVTGCVAYPCKHGFPANDIRPVVNSAFLKDNPAVKVLLEEASAYRRHFAQNAKMNDGEGSTADVERHATEWVAAHADLVEGWLEKARAAAQ